MRNRLANHVKKTWETILDRTPTQVNAKAIAREIKVAVTPEEEPRLARARPVDPEAYQSSSPFCHKQGAELFD